LDRVTVSLLNHLGAVGRLYSSADPAPYSAMPALHVAVPSLIAATLIGIKGWRRKWAWLSALYPMIMTFATLYLGEHYVLDGVAGMALGVICYGAVRWAAHAGVVEHWSPRIRAAHDVSSSPHFALVGDAARPARITSDAPSHTHLRAVPEPSAEPS
jgi:hypothetical protein